MNFLQAKVSFFFIVLFLFCLGSPSVVLAESTIQCHCFTARTYNPADKYASDDYILATSFNSLLAKSFNIPKRQIIMIKMNEGISQDELLISFKLSEMTGEEPSRFYRQRQENNTWPQIISGLAQQESIKNNEIFAALRTGIPAAEAGARIADDMIGTFFGIAPNEIGKLRTSGLNEKEITLVFILAHARGQKPEILVDRHERQGMSWSEIANVLGLEPAAAGELILTYQAGPKSE
jgi:hypothetical protein